MTAKSLMLLLLVATVVAMPAAASVITLTAPTTANGNFDVVVNVTGVFDPPHDLDFLLGYGFDISYNSSILTYLGETAGPLFIDLSGNPGIGAQVAGIASNILLGPGDFTEPLTLAVLHFGVAGFGPAGISISGDPLNLDQGLIYLTGSDPIAASTSVTAVPEPATLSLMGFGVVALGRRLVRSRKSAES